MTEGWRICTLERADIEDAFRLSEAEGWNQTRADWLRLRVHEPLGCFACRFADELIGTVTTTVYGAELAWIGMMLVHREYRGYGIGKSLMEAALDYLTHSGVTTVKLDATPLGQPLYLSFGFTPEVRIERWEGFARRREHSGSAEDGHHRAALHRLDRDEFGIDRSRMLDLLINQGPLPPSVVLSNDGRVLGFGLTRNGAKATYLGPVVTSEPDLTTELVDAALGQLAGDAVYIDFHSGSSCTPDLLLERGFVKQRELVRMRWGRPNDLGASPSVFAIAGPEIG
jgi:GNAT superfamily N-acetyltransferase